MKNQRNNKTTSTGAAAGATPQQHLCAVEQTYLTMGGTGTLG